MSPSLLFATPKDDAIIILSSRKHSVHWQNFIIQIEDGQNRSFIEGKWSYWHIITAIYFIGYDIDFQSQSKSNKSIKPNSLKCLSMHLHEVIILMKWSGKRDFINIWGWLTFDLNPLLTKQLHCLTNFTLNHNEWPTNLRYARYYWFSTRTQSMSNELLVICMEIYLESNPLDFLCDEKQQVPWLLINNRYNKPNAIYEHAIYSKTMAQKNIYQNTNRAVHRHLRQRKRIL